MDQTSTAARRCNNIVKAVLARSSPALLLYLYPIAAASVWMSSLMTAINSAMHPSDGARPSPEPATTAAVWFCVMARAKRPINCRRRHGARVVLLSPMEG